MITLELLQIYQLKFLLQFIKQEERGGPEAGRCKETKGNEGNSYQVH
jgi:hypothetical protein